FVLFTSGLAQAQTQTNPAPPIDPQQQERIERELQEIKSMKKDLQRQLGDFDARIKALETELNPRQTNKTTAAGEPSEVTNGLPATATASATLYSNAMAEAWGAYDTGKGLVAVRSSLGELGFGVLGYLRYLNKLDVDPTYTDAFGRTHPVQRRNDF